MARGHDLHSPRCMNLAREHDRTGCNEKQREETEKRKRPVNGFAGPHPFFARCAGLLLGTYQIPAFLLYTPRRRPGGTGILPVAGWTGFTELNGWFLSCVDLSTGSDRSLLLFRATRLKWNHSGGRNRGPKPG